MARILCTGNLTLDVINTVEHYPAEDEELRAIAHDQRCGGNAANTAQVLSQLGQGVYLAGVIAEDSNGQWLQSYLCDSGINVDHLIEKPGISPTSYITHNQATGSRTIVHVRELPELSQHEFQNISKELIDWFHFEGRNTEALGSMIAEVKSRRIDQPISLEMEKHRTGLHQLAKQVDILLFSKPYVERSGFDNPEHFLNWARSQFPKALMSVTWGEQGAWGSQVRSQNFHIPATNIPQVIDSVGAGDTYNAGVINSLCSGQTLREAITAGCRLAERKLICNGLSKLFM